MKYIHWIVFRVQLAFGTQSEDPLNKCHKAGHAGVRVGQCFAPTAPEPRSGTLSLEPFSTGACASDQDAI